MEHPIGAIRVFREVGSPNDGLVVEVVGALEYMFGIDMRTGRLGRAELVPCRSVAGFVAGFSTGSGEYGFASGHLFPLTDPDAEITEERELTV